MTEPDKDKLTEVELELEQRKRLMDAFELVVTFDDRWTVGDTVSGSGPNEQVHILVKPMEANLSTNAIITSTKRTYYLDLKSFADTYMAAVSWRYPAEAIKRFFAPRMEEPQLINASFTLAEAMPSEEDMRFDYIIKGDTPRWRPTRVFDDGAKVFIEFPAVSYTHLTLPTTPYV